MKHREMHVPVKDRGLPVLALVFNAAVWGLSWWPFRQLTEQGLHVLWASALVFSLSAAVLTLWRPQAFLDVLRTPALWMVMISAGITNAAFNWGVSEGNVVRVVLLFYLLPLWMVLLARWLLREPLTPQSMGQVGLAFLGAMMVLWPEGGLQSWTDLPWPRSGPDWLGVLGGFCFALNNVLIKRVPMEVDSVARPLAMFLGGVVLAGGLAAALTLHGKIASPPSPDPGWVLGVAALSLCFLCSNACYQYGALRLPAQLTAVVMLSEVAFASVSALWLGAGELTATMAWGGLCILVAAWLATTQKEHPSDHAPGTA